MVTATTATTEMPRAGVDYPGTWQAFEKWFPDEAACRVYLERLRWPEGFSCPVCATPSAWRTASGSLMCTACGRKTSVTAGTIFHRSRTPLKTWFAACWFVCSQKNGVSALGLQRVLGFGSYETAWAWMHKLRRAMVRPDRDQLSGIVELDETFIGARGTAGKRSSTIHKAVVGIAVERTDDGFGRVRLKHYPSSSAANIRPFVYDAIAPGTTVHTDGWHGYPNILKDTYNHQSTSVIHSADPAHVVLPGVHRVASLLKRWLAGTHHDGFAQGQLEYYLDEFTFRFNRRTSLYRGKLFHRLLEQAVAVGPRPYAAIAKGARGRRKRTDHKG